MRYSLLLKLEKPQLPLDYRPLILSIIKSSLKSMSGDDVYSAYFSETKQKDLCWSIKLKQPIFHKTYIDLSSNHIEVCVSHQSIKEGSLFFSSLMSNNRKRFPSKNNNGIVIDKVKLLREREINESVVIFKTYSPICIREHIKQDNKDIYFAPGDDAYDAKLIECISRNAPSELYEECKKLSVDTSELRKIIITLYGQKIQCAIGRVKCTGSKDVLMYLYRSGIGVRKSLGFGMVNKI